MNKIKGQMAGPAGAVVGALTVAMLLIIGLIVFSNFEASVDHSTISTDASTQINATADQTYSAFSLGSVLPLVLFAVAVIGVVLAAFAFGRR